MAGTPITPEQLAKSGTEHGHQAALFCWCSQNIRQYPQLKRLFAIPNGGLRNPATAARLKAEGVKSGVPDIMLAIPIGKWHGLFIEMKIGRNQPTNEQEDWLVDLSCAGYYTAVCHEWTQARNIVVNYLDGKL